MSLAQARGVVFALDGCVWTGAEVAPGAAELIAELARRARGVAFLTNNSRATAQDIHARLAALGIEADRERVLTPLEIFGEFIRERYGRSRVLVIGADEMSAVVRAAGHEVLPVERCREATVVAVGNDFDLSYARLTAAARAVAAGAGLVTPNVDPRLPIEGGDFLPGCGAIVEAVAIAGGRRPEIAGKPERPRPGGDGGRQPRGRHPGRPARRDADGPLRARRWPRFRRARPHRPLVRRARPGPPRLTARPAGAASV